jgi:ABC-2 type transport system ATP-binding protein
LTSSLPTPPTVVVRDLVQGYGSSVVLDGLSLRLEPGATTLLGVNGAGKTTLMRSLVGDLAPRSGSILWEDPTGQTGLPAGTAGNPSIDATRIRRRTGYLPQDPELPAQMRVGDMVAYAAWLKLVPRNRVRRCVERALRQVDLLDRIRDRVKTLSGGMKQRAALAAAVVHDPALLVLDEPTSGLDPRQRIEIRRLIRTLAEDRSVLISTHLLPDVPHLGGGLVVLHQGAVLLQGTATDLEARADETDSGESALERGFLSLVEGLRPSGPGNAGTTR